MEYYYDYGTSSSFGWIFWWVLWLALTVWMIVCMWKVFKKAGRKWRESLIPIRNVWVLFKIAGKTPRFRVLVAVPVLSLLFSLLQWVLPSFIGSAIARILWLAWIVCLIATITIWFWLSKKFNKARWFAVWLLLLSPIFLWVLAFDDSKYSA